jgi:hypothetical protein
MGKISRHRKLKLLRGYQGWEKGYTLKNLRLVTTDAKPEPVKLLHRISQPSLFIREIEILLQLNHPHIVLLVGYSMPTEDEPARLAIVLVDDYSVSDRLRSNLK